MSYDAGSSPHDVSLAHPPGRDHLDSAEHTVQFYGDDGALLDGLSSFVASALVAGDAVILIATREHRTGLERQLRARGVDMSHALSAGRYFPLDAAGVLSAITVDGWPDSTRFFELLGGIFGRARTTMGGKRRRVAAFGEMVALLLAAGKPEAAMRLEKLWNDLARTHQFYLRCAYPIDFFSEAADGEVMRQICEEHSRVIPTESFTSLPTEEERLRAVALLQQNAQALATELAERKRMERALLEMNRELRQAIAARDQFLSVAAHELKTPLTAIRAFAQLLLRDARRERTIAPGLLEAALDTIESQTGKLNQLLARLLDSTQIQAGKLRIEPVSTDLVAIIHSALAQQHPAKHTLVFDGPEYLEGMVDLVRFEQVVANLLDNAVRFSPWGGTVTVSLDREGDDGILLSVTDQGVGIPPDQRESVFDRYYQAHGDRHLSGMGLGLYITREIVELHGGSVRIEDPGQGGSRFIVSIPAAAGNSQDRLAA